MDENIPPKDNNKKSELEALLKAYPLPEKYKDKAELVLSLKKIITSLHKQDEENNNFENYKKTGIFTTNLINKYGNARQYYLFHLLIGSTISNERMSLEFDFPEEDSIKKYLESQNH